MDNIMNKDYGMLMCEDCIKEIGYGGSAAIGAGVGAGISAAVWAKKRLGLNKKLKSCSDDECRTKIKNAIKKLRSRALKYGAAVTVAGAGAGMGAKALYQHKDMLLKGNKQVASDTEKVAEYAKSDGIQTALSNLGPKPTRPIRTPGQSSQDYLDNLRNYSEKMKVWLNKRASIPYMSA